MTLNGNSSQNITLNLNGILSLRKLPERQAKMNSKRYTPVQDDGDESDDFETVKPTKKKRRNEEQISLTNVSSQNANICGVDRDTEKILEVSVISDDEDEEVEERVNEDQTSRGKGKKNPLSTRGTGGSSAFTSIKEAIKNPVKTIANFFQSDQNKNDNQQASTRFEC